MSDIIRGFIVNISIIVVLAVLVDIIMPESNYRKYTNFVFGLILLVVLIKPILHIFNSADTLSETIFTNSIKLENQVLSQQSEIFQQAQEEQIVDTYKNNLEVSIASALNIAFELQNTDVHVKFMSNNIVNAKNIFSIEVLTEKRILGKGVNPISINLENQYENETNVLSESDIELAKAYLSELYNLDKESIIINNK